MTTSFILSGLHIYPIKSATGIALPTAQVEARGLQGDRHYLITDLRGKFITQRQLPRMALIRVGLGNALGNNTLGRLDCDRLTLEAPGMLPLNLFLTQAVQPVEVEIWGDRTQSLHCGLEAQVWLSEFLQIPCQLVYMPDDAQRPTAHGQLGADQLLSFADAYPFLLISEASLADLNGRLSRPVPMNRFRPNLVVSGCDAFAEDTWARIRIGPVEFDLVKGCDRCSVPGVDQATGIQVQEPLPTLAKYRLRAGKIWFGQNLVQRGLGPLQVGDAVEILATKL